MPQGKPGQAKFPAPVMVCSLPDDKNHPGYHWPLIPLLSPWATNRTAMSPVPFMLLYSIKI